MSFKFIRARYLMVVIAVCSLVLISLGYLKIQATFNKGVPVFGELQSLNEKFVIDRIEGDFAVCEATNGRIFNYSCSSLPLGIEEGSVIRKINGKLKIDTSETVLNRKRVDDKANELWD